MKKRFIDPTSPNSYPRHFWPMLECRRSKMDAADNDNEPCYLTYRWLQEQLSKLTEEQLNQHIQVFNQESETPGKLALLQPVYAIGTVEELLHVDGVPEPETRGPDFAHHPEQVIICIDGAPFSQEGDSYYTMQEDGMIGNKTGKLFPYGKRKSQVICDLCGQPMGDEAGSVHHVCSAHEDYLSNQ